MEVYPIAELSSIPDVLDSLLSKLTTHSFDNAHLEPLFADLESTIHLVNLWVTTPKRVDKSKWPRRFELQCHKLWNICVRSRRSLAVQTEPEITRKRGNKALMSVWLLSFLCLELSQIWSDEPRDQTKRAAYLMSLMVPVAKASVNDLDFETARLALQRGAAHLDNLSLAATRVEKQLPHNSTSFNLQVNLQAKYFAMRIWLVSASRYHEGPSLLTMKSHGRKIALMWRNICSPRPTPSAGPLMLIRLKSWLK